MLAELGVTEGEELTLMKTPDGYTLTKSDEKFKRTMEIAESFMKRHRKTLQELAK